MGCRNCAAVAIDVHRDGIQRLQVGGGPLSLCPEGVSGDVIMVRRMKCRAGQESGQSLWRQRLLGDIIFIRFLSDGVSLLSEPRASMARSVLRPLHFLFLVLRAGGHNGVQLGILREAVNKRDSGVPEEQQPFVCYAKGRISEDGEQKLWRLGTYKTLGTSLSDMQIFGKLGGTLTFFARKYLWENAERFLTDRELRVHAIKENDREDKI